MNVTREEAKEHRELLCGYWVSHPHVDFSGPVAIIDAYLTLLDEKELLERERDEADRQAGELLRKNEWLQDESQARARWLDKAKEQWGMHHHTSFDVIWNECLELKSQLTAMREENEKLKEQLKDGKRARIGKTYEREPFYYDPD